MTDEALAYLENLAGVLRRLENKVGEWKELDPEIYKGLKLAADAAQAQLNRSPED